MGVGAGTLELATTAMLLVCVANVSQTEVEAAAMTPLELKARILNNGFIECLQSKARVDEEAYRELCLLLDVLAVELRRYPLIDKELAYILYCIPLVARNALDSLQRHFSPTEVLLRVEVAWLELDARVAECLSGKTGVGSGSSSDEPMA
jgi:hypothetical protein